MMQLSELVEAGIAEGTKVARAEAKSLNDQAFVKIKESGSIEIIELTPEQVEVFRKVLAPVYDEYRDEIGADVIDAALEISKK